MACRGMRAQSAWSEVCQLSTMFTAQRRQNNDLLQQHSWLCSLSMNTGRKMDLTFHWLFSTNPVEYRAKYHTHPTFGSILYRIGGKQMGNFIFCPVEVMKSSVVSEKPMRQHALCSCKVRVLLHMLRLRSHSILYWRWTEKAENFWWQIKSGE